MPLYKVAVFKLGDANPSSFHDIALHDPLDAAEWVVGSRLATRGTADRLRARVWVRDEPDGGKWEFFVAPDSPPPKRRRSTR
jgi:hypothetical protein